MNPGECVYCGDPLREDEVGYHFNGVCDKEAADEARAEAMMEDLLLDRIHPGWRDE